MDSSGLGAVVRLYVSAKSAGCDLQLPPRGLSLRTENVAALSAAIKKFYETFSCH
jgi:hypothetical protein